jgi:hypothetical protein
MAFSWRSRNNHKLLQSQKLLSFWDTGDKSNTSVFLWELTSVSRETFDTNGTWSVINFFHLLRVTRCLEVYSSLHMQHESQTLIAGLPSAAELRAEIPEFVTYALEYRSPRRRADVTFVR